MRSSDWSSDVCSSDLFSEPYGVVPVVVGGPKAVKVESPKDLAGKAIAVTRGTTSDQVFTKRTKKVADVTIVRYQDDATPNTAVMSGQTHDLLAASSVLPDPLQSTPNSTHVTH